MNVFYFDGALFRDLWQTRTEKQFLAFTRYDISDHRPFVGRVHDHVSTRSHRSKLEPLPGSPPQSAQQRTIFVSPHTSLTPTKVRARGAALGLDEALELARSFSPEG